MFHFHHPSSGSSRIPASVALQFLALALLILAAAPLRAQVTLTHEAGKRLINLSARLTKQDGTNLDDGTKTMIFRLYEFPVGGDPLWVEVHPTVNVRDGYISVTLGRTVSFDTMQPAAYDPDEPAAGFPPYDENDAKPWIRFWSTFQRPLYLGVSVDIDGLPENPPLVGGVEAELLPRQEIIPRVFAHDAFAARHADALSHQPPTVQLAPPAPTFWRDPVTLDASATISPRGEALAFNWNVTGNGAPDLAFPAANDVSTTATLLGDEPGVFQANVFVRDERGLVAGESTLAERRATKQVDDAVAEDVGSESSSVLIQGYPAAVYYDAGNGRLKYRIALADATMTGGGAWTEQIVDDGGDGPGGTEVGRYPSMVALASGRPGAAYFDSTNGDLKWAFATTDDGTGGAWTAVSVETAGTVGEYCSAALVSGNPAISYYDRSNGQLMFVRAASADGSSWGAPVTVDDGGDGPGGAEVSGTFTSLEIVNGNPAIAYHDVTNGTLIYVRATDASGAAWGTPVTADAAPGSVTGEFTSLKRLSSLTTPAPAIAYTQITGGDVPPDQLFAQRRTIDTDALPFRNIGIGDIDLDGYQDVIGVQHGTAGANWNDGRIFWYKNPGTPEGLWTEYTIRSPHRHPNSVYAANLDGDPDLELIIGAAGGNSIFTLDLVVLNITGDRTQPSGWTQAYVSDTNDFPYFMFVADIDQDSDLDFAAGFNGSNPSISQVSWYRNNGGLGFTRVQLEVGVVEPFGVTGGLLVGNAAVNDNRVDLVISEGLSGLSGASVGRVLYYKNDPGAPDHFQVPVVVHTNSTNKRMGQAAVADVDGDGNPDILTGYSEENRVSWWRGDGDESNPGGPFEEGRRYLGSMPGGLGLLQLIQVGDLDLDGDPDVIASDYFEAGWFENDDPFSTDWTFYPIDLSNGFTSPNFIIPADLDGDGDLDLVGIDETAPGSEIGWWENRNNMGSGAQIDLENPAPSDSTQFGNSVDVSAEYAVTGAHGNGTGAPASGQAYIFNVLTGELQATINNPSPATNDFFGIEVAISGSLALISARDDDTGATDAGSVYLFDAATGALLRTFNNPAPSASEYFGVSIDIDEPYVLIGAYRENTYGTGAGLAYLYHTGTGALLHTFNHPSPSTNDFFGEAVSVCQSYALVNAPLDDTGATDTGIAFLFTTSDGVLVRTFTNPTPQTLDIFGESVAVTETHALISAYLDDTGATDTGIAYLFDVNTGAIIHTFANPTPAVSDEFGFELALSDKYALIGARYDDTDATNAGGAYLFDIETGELIRSYFHPAPDGQDFFGYAVALSDAYAFIGAYGHDVGGVDHVGSAHLFPLNPGSASFLKLVVAQDADGAMWHPAVKLDSGGGVGAGNSLGVINGVPALAYSHGIDGALRYAVPNNFDPMTFDGSGGWRIITPDGSGSVGGSPSLVEIQPAPATGLDPMPGITYYDADNASLKYTTFPEDWPGE